MKRLLPLGVIIVGLLIILFIVRRCTQSSAAGYQTATVTRGPITQLVTATGTLNPVVNVQVGSQVSGNIAKLFADWPTLISLSSIVVAFMFSAAVGIFFGFYPARKAAALDPIEALRYE